jgi:hypothetical protein
MPKPNFTEIHSPMLFTHGPRKNIHKFLVIDNCAETVQKWCMAIRFAPIGDGVALKSVAHPKGAGLKRGRPTKERSAAAKAALEMIEIELQTSGTPLRVGRPRVEDRAKTLEATKPWLALGMSRRTWFARRKADREGK